MQDKKPISLLHISLYGLLLVAAILIALGVKSLLSARAQGTTEKSPTSAVASLSANSGADRLARLSKNLRPMYSKWNLATMKVAHLHLWRLEHSSCWFCITNPNLHNKAGEQSRIRESSPDL